MSLGISRSSIHAVLLSLLGTSSRSINSSSCWSSTSKPIRSIWPLQICFFRMPKSKSKRWPFWATFKTNDNQLCPVSNRDQSHVHNQLVSSPHLSSTHSSPSSCPSFYSQQNRTLLRARARVDRFHDGSLAWHWQDTSSRLHSSDD